MFSHIKTDLNLAGISMKFASVGIAPQCPTGDCVAKGSQGQLDAHALLKDGRELHVVSGKNKRLKVTLVKDESSPNPEIPHLWWVDIETMRDAIACGVLKIGDQILEFKITRQLKSMLARASLAGAS